MDTILKISGITKQFPGVKALDNVSFDVERGEVHAVVGENGAGKSTLMKILGGLYSADFGEITINGKKTAIRGVLDSLKSGISVIYQEFNLVPMLTVAENIFLTRLPGKSGVVNRKKLNEKCSELMHELRLDINPSAMVSELSVSEMQMVEIAKAVSFDSSIVIMDEPTASLNDKEVATLYRLIDDLKRRGTTILYISHRMKEIFDLSDRITVLRDGCKIGTYNTNEITEEELIHKMVGRDITKFYHSNDDESSETGEVVLEVNQLCKEGFYKDISFQLHRGEILGLGGLMGCHREEIAKTLFGLMHPDSGTIVLNGKPIQIDTPADAIRNRIMFSTDDRKNEGILPDMGVDENITIAVLNKICKGGNGLINYKTESAFVKEYTDYMQIKYASPSQHILHLSGGNQQKVLLARSLLTDCEVLILMEPTRGIDVGAKSEIYSMLRQLAARGIAILMITSETQELITLCDRAIVIYRGTISGALKSNDSGSAAITEDNLMFCATGNKHIFYEGAKQ